MAKPRQTGGVVGPDVDMGMGGKAAGGEGAQKGHHLEGADDGGDKLEDVDAGVG